jgi:hypothetical protein
MTKLRHQTRIPAVALILFLFGGLFAHAQFLSGIEGNVRDSSGAAIAGAKVVVTDTSLGVKKTVTTNEAGYFRIDSIAASTYSVEIQMIGFKTWQEPHLVLQVGQTRTLAPVLEVGTVSTSVTVSASDIALDLVSPTTGAVISENTLATTPLPGQNVYSLAGLTPGMTGNAVTSGDNFTNEYAININAAGLRQELNGYMIDGAFTDKPSRGGGTSISPMPEIVESIEVETNTFDAAKGRNAGAMVDVFTKSGTNDLHGAFDYYFTNNSLQALTHFQNSLPTSKRSEYSFAMGGPAIKTKLFWFGAVDVLRSGVATSYQTEVETQDFDNWAKANLPNSLGTQTLLMAPPQLFPTSGFLTVGQITGSYYPIPAGIPSTLNALGTTNINYTLPKNGYQWNARGDYYRSQSDRFYVGAIRMAETSEGTTGRPALDVGQFYSSDFVNADWTHTFSSHLVNEGGGNMIRPYGQFGGRPAFVIPYVTVTGMNGFSNWGPGNFAQTTVGWRDILTDSVRVHTLKFGFEQDNVREADEQQTGGGARPFYNFNSLLDFVQGLPFSETGSPVDLATHSLAQFVYARRALYTGIFAQDDWKVTRRFTLNLGVRYDAMAHLFAITSPKLTNFAFGQGTSLNQQIANGTVAYTAHDYFVDHNPWYITPRVGFAWDVFGDGKTSLRGGIGMFSDQPPFIQFTSQTGNPPLVFTPVVSVLQGNTPVFQFCSPPSGFDETCPVVDTTNVTVNSSGGVLINGVLNKTQVTGYDPKSTMAQVYDWTLSLQRELMRNLIVEVNYSASAAHRLPVLPVTTQGQINRFAGDLIVNKGQSVGLNPNFGTIIWGSTNANSIGNFGSVSVRHQATRGLALAGTYTYGKALDPFSTAGSLDTGYITPTTDIIIQNFDLAAQRGRSDFDIRQQFSATGTWTVPNNYNSTLARNTLGGWQFGGVWVMQTGLPFTVYTTAAFQPVFDAQGNVVGNRGGDYNADGFDWDVPNVPSFGAHLSGKKKMDYLNGLFSASSFPTPALGQEGKLGRNTYDEPGYNNLNFTFAKSFNTPWFFGEKMNVEAKGEVINLFNRSNLDFVTSDMSSSLFGHATSQLPARYLQLHLRANF